MSSQVRVCVCVSSAELTQPFFSSRLSERLPCQRHGWTGAFLSLSPTLSPPPSPSMADSLSHVSTDHRFVLQIPPCSPAKRESPSCHRHRQRDGPGTQIGRDTSREGGGGERSRGGAEKCTLSSLLYLTVFSLCRYPSERLGDAEWWARDAHWHRVCDTRWLMVKTFEEGYDLNSVIYVITLQYTSVTGVWSVTSFQSPVSFFSITSSPFWFKFKI